MPSRGRWSPSGRSAYSAAPLSRPTSPISPTSPTPRGSGDAEHLADAADLCGAGDLLGAGDRLYAADLAAVESAPTDEAFLVGAAHVAVIAACDAAVLTPAALALAAADALPIGTRFLQDCRRLVAARAAIRRELAAWAADQHPETAERAVLTAQALSLELAEALRP